MLANHICLAIPCHIQFGSCLQMGAVLWKWAVNMQEYAVVTLQDTIEAKSLPGGVSVQEAKLGVPSPSPETLSRYNSKQSTD